MGEAEDDGEEMGMDEARGNGGAETVGTLVEAEAVVTIEAPAAVVWERVADFDGMPSWHPVIAASTTEGTGVGAVRTLTLHDGSMVRERLDAHDPEARRYAYSIVDDSAFPYRDYHAHLAVEPLAEDRCRVRLGSRFRPDGLSPEALREGLGQFYRRGLDHLKGLVESA